LATDGFAGVTAMDCSTGELIKVGSVVDALADPPPLTATKFIWGDVALPKTFTVTVIGSYVAPAFSVSLRVHAVPPTGQVHPAPAMDASVIPDGAVSVIVTLPLVLPAPLFVTVIV
jgi:hypothetical protein